METIIQLDITKEHCPMTLVKVKLELSKIKKGDLLEVTLSGGEPLENVPRAAEEHGHKVLSVEKLDDTKYKVKIEK